TVNGVSRTVHAVATTPSSYTVDDRGVWNYLYGGSESGHATNTCETTIQGGTSVTVPILIRDNLCITGGSHVINAPSPAAANQLKVGNNLTVNGGSNVGTSSSKLNTVEVGGKCNGPDQSVPFAVTAGNNPCDGNHSPIWATHVSSSLDVTLDMPCI